MRPMMKKSFQLSTALLLSTLLFPGSAAAYGPTNATWTVVSASPPGGGSWGTATRLENGGLRFEGRMARAGHGGVSSVRSDSPDYSLPGPGSFLLTVRGDGRTYNMDLRTGPRMDEISYRASFPTTDGEVTQVLLPLDKFEATRLDRVMEGVGALTPADVASIGFGLNVRQAGSFRLEVLTIDFDTAPLQKVASPRALISRSIQLGAPLYNRGDRDACAAVYDLTVNGLILLPEDQLPRTARVLLEAARDKAQQQSDPSDQAWTLRTAMDQVLLVLPK